MTKPSHPTTDFGYQTIPVSEKTDRVSEVFESVATRYDLMNDLMSFFMHRIWKRFAIQVCQLRPGQRILDLAGGTADLTARMSPIVGDHGQVILADINAAMLAIGRRRLLDQGRIQNVSIVQANAESLPFPSHYFDRILIGFGLRNITDKHKALTHMLRVLKPGGQVIILEFSQPTLPVLSSLYDEYSLRILPWLGKVIANDEASYRYLAESIRQYPNPDTILSMMETAGLNDCRYQRLNAGIVTIHKGYKY